MLTYDTEPTPEEVSRTLFALDGLYRDVRPDALRIKDALPGKRLGGTLLFSRAAVDAWIARQPDIAPSPVAVPAVAPNNVIPIRGNANADQIQTDNAMAH